MNSNLLKKSFTIAGNRTSVALEPEFWNALERIAARQGLRLSQYVASIASTTIRPLASTLRVTALSEFDAETCTPALF